LSIVAVLLAVAAIGSIDPSLIHIQAKAQLDNKTTYSNQPEKAGQYTITGEPTISADFIDTVLCKYNSPACHTGYALHSYGQQHHIDPVYALAFFLHESTFGKYRVASRNSGLGNIRCTAGYTCKSGFRAYSSWVAGYLDWYRLINDLYIKEWNLTTVDQIIPKYAPAADNNNEAAYISAIKQSVDLWRAGNPSIP
jgi:Mannosyl-glycoprotein endo-beta-N-acetylglucosaminidase